MRGLFILTYLFFSVISFGQSYEIQEVKLVAKLQTIKGINEKTDEFSPIILGKELYFTSNKIGRAHV